METDPKKVEKLAGLAEEIDKELYRPEKAPATLTEQVSVLTEMCSGGAAMEQIAEQAIELTNRAVKELEESKKTSELFFQSIQNMRKQFAGQLQQTMNSLQACEKQVEQFKQQIEQIKGALFALDQLATATKGGPYGREERATEEVIKG